MNYNSLIAEFMNLPFKDGYYINDYEVMSYFPQLEYSRKLDELEFHYSWDWLMPVVNKIEIELKEEFRVVILEDECTIHQKTVDGDLQIQFRTIVEAYETSKIEAVYKAVVEFIKWYNDVK